MNTILVKGDTSKNKVFKDKAIGAGAFLGGPLAAGYFLAENFKAINQPEKVKKTWIITILATIAIFSIAFIIPANSRFPNQLIPAVYTFIAYLLFKNYQEKQVLEKIESGGTYHSWWRVIGASVVCLLITGAIIGMGIFGMIELEESQIATKQYGLTVKHEIEYNTSNLTEIEVNNIADGFIEHAFFDLDTAKYIYAEKEGDTFEIYIPISEFYINDPETLQKLTVLREKMDSYIKDETVIINLVVDSYDDIIHIIK